MHIWLGSELGHQPLQGLTSDNPSQLAAEFISKFELPQEAFEELRTMIEMKIHDYLNVY